MNEELISFVRSLIVERIPKQVTLMQRDKFQRDLKARGLQLIDSEIKIVTELVREYEILEGARTADYILRRLLK